MTEMLPQPPPDAPPPPPSEAALRSQRWYNWMLVVGIGSVLLLFIAGLVAPVVTPRKPDLTEALNNARQIGFPLHEFEMTYGAFPSDQTAKTVKDSTSSSLHLGSKTSNDYFRQLIAAEMCQSEALFYARTPHSRKPDNVFTGTEALKKGECAFAYIAGLTTKHPPETPIVIVPLIPGKRTFDKKLCDKHYNGKAVILRVDNSVTAVPVDATGRVWINGKDLFDPSQPFWGGKAPDVKWPE